MFKLSQATTKQTTSSKLFNIHFLKHCSFCYLPLFGYHPIGKIIFNQAKNHKTKSRVKPLETTCDPQLLKLYYNTQTSLNGWRSRF